MASKNNAGKSYGSGRTRNYATIIYPESAPSDWEQILTDEKVQALASPLHDQDVNPDGESKKPHRHIILRFDAVKTPEQAKEVFDKIGGVGCEKVKDLRQYARYLCHLDNPEKAQYPTDEVLKFGGIDYFEMVMSAADEVELLKEITFFVNENHVTNFSAFQKWTAENKPDWFRLVAKSSAYYVAQLIKAERYNEK